MTYKTSWWALTMMMRIDSVRHCHPRRHRCRAFLPVLAICLYLCCHIVASKSLTEILGVVCMQNMPIKWVSSPSSVVVCSTITEAGAEADTVALGRPRALDLLGP